MDLSRTMEMLAVAIQKKINQKKENTQIHDTQKVIYI